MTFWKVVVKYSKIALPDVILFSNKPSAEYYKEQKEKNNGLVVWITISDKSMELPISYD